MTTTAPNFKKTCPSAPGMSLMELLVTIVILGLIMSITVMSMGSSRQAAEDQKDKRNAQEIASVAAMANAAGASFIVPDDEQATIANLRDGIAPATGAFRGRTFRIPDMHDTEIKGAMRFLALNDSDLQYRQDGSNSP
ncbi:type II secretion system protein [Prosthecobacter sp.]|uniref:type II secretion system protein n=1 Tax=Prosthecobacter sp. TaxID=1965333 RepID=UPI0037CAD24C